MYKEIHAVSADEDKLTLKNVTDEITLHFSGRDNVVFSRYQFRCCHQQEGESVDAWYNRLCEAAESCQFDKLKDSLIRDQIVACCHSANLRKRLLNVPNITLSETLKLARTYKAANQQAAIMEQGFTATEETVQAIWHQQRQSSHRASSSSLKCIRCGGDGHKTCNRARGKRCDNCGKLNHFAKACLSEKSNINILQQVTESPSEDEVFYVPTDKHKDATFDAIINNQKN